MKVPVLVMYPLLWLNTTIKSNLGGPDLFDLQTQLIVDGNQGTDKHCSLPFLLSCSACFLLKSRITTHSGRCCVISIKNQCALYLPKGSLMGAFSQLESLYPHVSQFVQVDKGQPAQYHSRMSFWMFLEKFLGCFNLFLFLF